MKESANRSRERPYLGILFECCGVYDRVYRQPDEKQYQGRCPRCLRAIKVHVDPRKGSSSKFWKAE